MPLKRCLQKYASVSPCFDTTKTKIKKCDHRFNFELTEAMQTSLYNWRYKTLPEPQLISGPLTLTRHRLKTNDESFDVYIFGELHGNDSDCRNWKNLAYDLNLPDQDLDNMPVDEFLLHMVKSSPVFLDLFIENERITQKHEQQFLDEWDYENDSYIFRLRNALRPYTPKIHEANFARKLKNVRIHDIDTRLHDFLGKFLFDAIIVNEIEHNVDLQLEFVASLRKFLQMYESHVDTIAEFYLSSHINAKEYSKLTKRNKRKLKRIFEDMFNTKVLQNNEIDQITNALFTYDTNHDFNELYTSVRHNPRFFALHMDIYFIARFLKGFDAQNEPRKPYHSIIYAGNGHADHYREIFEKLGFDSENLIENCVLSIPKSLNIENCDYLTKKYNLECTEHENEYELSSKRCIKIKSQTYPMFDIRKCEREIRDEYF